jgi:dolichol-phosphate mannosyltransferase
VVASRYCGSGDSSGLSSSWRRAVSSGSTLLARACFPRRVGRVCTDPMTGFFCVRRSVVQLDRLRPRGFKILLEILARHDLVVAEIPFAFGERHDGESKASWRNGAQFLYQMAALRMGKMSRFAAVGALGTVVNLVLMWLLLRETSLHYLPAAVIATEVAIAHNFVLQERFVFGDLKDNRHPRWLRFVHSVLYNNVDTLVRLPVLALLVEVADVPSVLAQGLTLGVAFLARFVFVSTVVYRPRRSPEEALAAAGPPVDVMAIAPLQGVSTPGGEPADERPPPAAG